TGEPVHRGQQRGRDRRSVDCAAPGPRPEGAQCRPSQKESCCLSRRTEIQVGATVLVALGITLWGVTWLKELSLTKKVRVWQVTFPQTGGLSTSDEVQVNGLRKGAVSSVQLVGDHVLVNLAITS